METIDLLLPPSAVGLLLLQRRYEFGVEHSHPSISAQRPREPLPSAIQLAQAKRAQR